MKRSMTVATMVVASTLALAACGRSADDGGGGGGAPAPAPAISEGPATGNLTVWAMGAEGEKLPALVKEFEKANPGAKVTVTAIPWDSAYTKFKNSIAAKQTPDVAMVGTTWMGEFVDLGALEATPSSIDKSSFFEGPQKTTEVNGTSYAVPWYAETRLLYYRTDIATKAGVTEPPKDWDSLKAAAKAMKSKGGAQWGISLQPGETGSWQTVVPFGWSNGAKIMNDDHTQFTFDTPEMAEALTYYQSFFTEGLANKAPGKGQDEANFTSGRVPMFIGGPWMMKLVEDMGGAGFAQKYDVAPFPGKKASTSFAGGSNLAVFTGTKNRDSAWKLVQWLSDAKTQVKWYQATTDLPAVQKAWEDPALSKDAKLAKFGEALKSAQAPPSVATWEQVAEKFDAQVEQVTKAGADPAGALKQAQADAAAIGTGK